MREKDCRNQIRIERRQISRLGQSLCPVMQPVQGLINDGPQSCQKAGIFFAFAIPYTGKRRYRWIYPGKSFFKVACPRKQSCLFSMMCTCLAQKLKHFLFRGLVECQSPGKISILVKWLLALPYTEPFLGTAPVYLSCVEV